MATIRRAAKLTSVGMVVTQAAAGEGAADNDIAAAMYNAVVRGGGEYFSLQPIVTTGARSGVPHSTVRRTRLAAGDAVFMELSASYDDYGSTAMRSVSIGPPPDQVKRAHDAALTSVSALTDTNAS